MTDTLRAVIALVVIVLGLVLGFIDHDAGGYVDGLNTRAMFSDKAVHAVCAIGLTFGLARVVPLPLAVLVTCVAGLCTELGQSYDNGFFSKWDLAADVAGALLVWGYISIT